MNWARMMRALSLLRVRLIDRLYCAWGMIRAAPQIRIAGGRGRAV